MKVKYIKAFLAMLVLPLAAGCNPVVVGDSIMNMSRPNVAAHLSGSSVNAADGRGAYNAGVNGQPGTGIQAVQAEVANVDAGGWMVVELGTNNMDFDAAHKQFFIAQVVSALPDNKCLAWVTPYVPLMPTQSAAWLASLQAYLPAQPCHTIVRWDLAAAGHNEYFADLVHPNALGKEVLVCTIAAAIGRPC